MVKFFEERFTENIQFGSGFDEAFDVDEQRTSANIYTRLRNPFPLIAANVVFTNLNAEVTDKIIKLYKKVGGTFAGFRFKNPYEFTTNNYIEAPTANDQNLVELAAGRYQLTLWYEDIPDSETTRKYLRKPVTDTALVGIKHDVDGNFTLRSAFYTVDYTKGEITLVAEITKNITAITQAAQAVATLADVTDLQVGDSLYIASVAGMVEINTRRAAITNIAGNNVTLDIDTTGFTAYTSGGTARPLPQAGETVQGGCEFDLPVKFDSRLRYDPRSGKILDSSVDLIEFHNPDPQQEL